jgi:hypothetical protein
LRREPQARPAARDVLARLRANDARESAVRPTRTDAGFVGREAELARLMEFFDASAAGDVLLCVVHGESGIGKSRTVRHFADEQRRRRSDAVILEGRCRSSE